ncbi:WASH complex subunit 2 [Condylostylus longicornis]|uniref:WASH complex subunit 2 n=1 Tax=Condylostylus longicornis TaxID=2530218 RepID=UPI00244DE12F|nr:WASH complex subunit 2 [Condylostylus longicornis]
MAPVHWTFEDVKKNASNWNLEGDSQLLELMKSISNNLSTRANTTKANLNKMDINLEKSCIAFENASNKLSALSKTQFVESRVFDDDETKPKQVSIENEMKVYNPNETLKIILDNNLKMLENCYEKVLLNLDDSDEEDEQAKSTIIYRPKNLYAKRLPALIGSEEWNEKWHIGLLDSDDESASEKGNAPEEFSDDSAENISLPSIGPTISESGSSVWSISRVLSHQTRKLNNKFDPSSDEEAISSNTFLSKTSSEDTRKTKSKKVERITEEKYYVHKPKEKRLSESSDSERENNKDKSRINSVKKHQTLKSEQSMKREILPKVSNIFSDEPPDLDLDETLKESNQNFVSERLDTQSKALFTDGKSNYRKSDRQTSKENYLIQNDSLAKTNDALFSENDFDSLVREINEKSASKTMQTSISKKVNLFYSDSEPESENRKADVNSESFSSTINNSSKTKIDILSKITQENNENENNNKKGRDLLLYPNNARNLFDDFEDEVDLFLPIKTEDKISGSLSSALLYKTKIANLFDDEPPEDDFDNLFQASRVKDSKIYGNKTDDNTFIEGNLEQEIKVQCSESQIKKIDESVLQDSEEKSETSNNKIDSGLRNSTLTQDKLKTPCEKKGVSTEQTGTLFSSDWSDDDDSLFSTKKAQKKLSSDFAGAEEKDITNKSIESILKKQSGNSEKVSVKSPPPIPPMDINFPTNSEKSPEVIQKRLPLLTDEVQSNLNVNLKLSSEKTSAITKNTLENNTEANHVSSSNVNNQNTKDSGSLDKTEVKEKIHVGNKQDFIANISTELTKDLSQSSYQHVNDEVLDETRKIVTSQDEGSEILMHNTFEEFDKVLNTENKVNNIVETSEGSSVQMKNEVYSLLFSDIPPEDEEIFNQNITSEDVMVHAKDATKTHVNFKSYNDNHIGLFDDIPPDDYVDDNKKNSENLFNEDFDNPAEVKFEKDIKSNYMISEEPPPDDYFKENSCNVNNDSHLTKSNTNTFASNDIDLGSALVNVKLKVDDVKTKLDEKYVNLSKSLSAPVSTHDEVPQSEKVFVAPEKIAQKPSKTLQQEGKSTEIHKSINESESVLKLANELNINVSALLPGAKRPVKNKESFSNVKTEFNEDINSKEISKVTKSEPSDITTEGKLIGLNKSRAKILVKRRPSTRKARQESYRKSIIDNDNFSDSEKDFKSMNKQISRCEEPRNTKRKSIQNTEEHQSFFSNLDTSTEVKIKNITSEKNLKRNNSLFDDSDEDLKAPNQTKQLSFIKKDSSHQVQHNECIKSLINQNNYFKNVNEFWDPKTAIPDRQTQSISDEIFSNIESPKNKPKSDFDNDCKQVPTLNFNKKTSSSDANFCASPPNQNMIKSGGLSSNPENDDDDLFSSPFVKVISSQTTNSSSIGKNLSQNQQNDKQSYDQSSSEIFKKISISKPVSDILEPHQQNDVLSVSSSKKLSNNKSKGLFSSDDEEDDSLFGGNSVTISSKKNNNYDYNTQTKPKTVLKQTKNMKEHRIKQSLFDDIEDDEDDDLFGTNKIAKAGTSKILNKSQPNRGAVPKRFVEKKVTKIEDTNNPLADLLD